MRASVVARVMAQRNPPDYQIAWAPEVREEGRSHVPSSQRHLQHRDPRRGDYIPQPISEHPHPEGISGKPQPRRPLLVRARTPALQEPWLGPRNTGVYPRRVSLGHAVPACPFRPGVTTGAVGVAMPIASRPRPTANRHISGKRAGQTQKRK